MIESIIPFGSIYIPLCFYFIWMPMGSVRRKSNLHSTMLLLYLRCASSVERLGALFTFHYASTLSASRDLLDQFIYIFTFHYASTLSKSPAHRISRGMEFTFHYASTLSLVNNCGPVWCIDLHSTMLLLYHRQPEMTVRLWWIYIPLCFYFIGCPAMLRCTAMLFTFHYASTLS